MNIRLDRAFAGALPYPDSSFDRVYSSFMYHHLGGDEKEAMLREARRILKPGGVFCLLDFEGTTGAHGSVHRWLHSSALLADNDDASILASMRNARFADPKSVRRGTLAFGLVAYSCYLAEVPSEATHDGRDLDPSP